MKYRNFKNRVILARWIFHGLHLVCGRVWKVPGTGGGKGRMSRWNAEDVQGR